MNKETFPTLNTRGGGNDFVAGHLRSQSYGGRGNDSNLVPMTRSLNALYHNRLEALIKKMRQTFPKSKANIELQFRLYTKKIKSSSGKEYVYVERIRVNVRLTNATKEELAHFDKNFRNNPDYR